MNYPFKEGDIVRHKSNNKHLFVVLKIWPKIAVERIFGRNIMSETDFWVKLERVSTKGRISYEILGDKSLTKA